MDCGVVEISDDGEAGFRLRLDPPDPSKPDQWFLTAKEARGCAGGIRLVTGRRKIDLTTTSL